jgi:hypothetical protein
MEERRPIEEIVCRVHSVRDVVNRMRIAQTL